jgi:drug/metabolite transporter (DMT)-like permease
MARIFFQEIFTKNKVLALLLCVAGCFLTITGGSLQSFQFDLKGILFGLAAGITFVSLTIISKPIADQYNHYTIVFYYIGFGALFYLPFSQPMFLFQSHITPLTWFYALSLSIISTVIALTVYFSGLATGIEASKAGIISTVEVVVSVIVSSLFFQEEIWGWKLLGILMVISSVIVVQLDRAKGMT